MFAPGNEFDGVGVNCPVLLVWGAEDKLTAAAVYGRRMQDRLRQAEWRELPDAGHIPMLDAPDEVASMILGFAEKLLVNAGDRRTRPSNAGTNRTPFDRTRARRCVIGTITADPCL
jgi:predicted dienelactone hydrolase